MLQPYFFLWQLCYGIREMEPREVSLLVTWSGDYPVSEMGGLPALQ
jgi:hypothetical protein